MRKTIILSLGLILILSGCASQTKVAQNNLNPDPNSNQNQENNNEEPSQATVCLDMCSNKIQNLCQEDIETFRSEGRNLEDTIYDEAMCQLMCEAEWDDDIFDCVSGADHCAQIFDGTPYCIETETEYNESPEPMATGCDKACRNYGKCASYGDDISPADVEDAYLSCMQICPTWTTKAQNCVAGTAINQPSDCAIQTACILPAVDALMR